MNDVNISQLSSIEGVLHTLWRVYQPQAVVHAGIGRGLGELGFWRGYQPAQVVMIEADVARASGLEPLFAQQPNWYLQNGVLGDGQPQMFYGASHPDESGLYPVTNLNRLWPNLRQTSAAALPTVALDELAVGNRCCCVVDFLPTAAVLAGAKQTLGQVSLLVMRVRLDGSGCEADVVVLSQSLAVFGLSLVAIWESNHPAIGYGVWVRESVPKAEVVALQLTMSEYENRIQVLSHNICERQNDINNSQQQLTAAKLLNETQAHHLVIAHAERDQAKRDAAAQLQALEQQLAEVKKANEAQALELSRANEMIHAERDQAKRDAAAQLQALEQQLAEAKSMAEVHLSELVAVKAEAERYQVERETIAQEYQQLKVKWEETQYRQRLIEEEMIKAEAQLELIKDVLLREPGL